MLQSIFRSAPTGIGVVSNRTILWFNDRFCQMLGYAAEELIGQSSRLLYLSDEDFQYVGMEKYRQIQEQGTGAVQTRWRRKDGSIIDVWLSSSPIDRSDWSKGVTFTALDITERCRAEQALCRSEDRFRSLVQQLSDIIWILSPEGQIEFVTESCRRTLGYSPEMLCGKSGFDFVHPDDLDKLRNDFREVLDRINPRIPTEFRFRHADGNWVWLAALGDNLLDQPSVAGLVITTRDITEKKRVEEELWHMQKLEVLGTLSRCIAHDFNNLLTPILGHLQLAKEDLGEGHAVLPRITEILKAGNRAADLIRQILIFSGRGEQQRKPVNVALVAGDALRLLRATLPSTITIVEEIDPRCPPILGDASQVHQVLMNLATNAFQAMEERGGALTVKLETVVPMGGDAPGTLAGVREPCLCLAVSDTGEGMDQETQARIFEPFFTTKTPNRGSGMGLAVVHGIVQSLNGAVAVESEKGKGSRFRIYLPAIADSNADQSSLRTELLRSGQAEHILLVDDEESIVAVAAEMLRRLGYRVSTARSGSAALQVFLANPDDFSLVITDQVMPGMTGLELTEALRKHRPSLPCLLVSGYADERSTAAAQRLGINGFLQKPIAMAELSRMISVVIGA